MPIDNQAIFTATPNSLETSSHETGTSSIALTGDPFTDLAPYGIILHGYTIRYRHRANSSGNTVTGLFNISGREETVGACNYRDLLLLLIERCLAHRRYVQECRKIKRRRAHAAWLARRRERMLAAGTIQ